LAKGLRGGLLIGDLPGVPVVDEKITGLGHPFFFFDTSEEQEIPQRK